MPSTGNLAGTGVVCCIVLSSLIVAGAAAVAVPDRTLEQANMPSGACCGNTGSVSSTSRQIASSPSPVSKKVSPHQPAVWVSR